MVSPWGLLLRVAVPVQVVLRVVALKELQRMRTLRPLSDGGPPGLELHYGSPESPRALWLELSQVRSAWACSLLLAPPELPCPAQLSLC